MLATSWKGGECDGTVVGVRPHLTRTVLQAAVATTSPACPWGCSGGHGRSWLLCSHLAFSTTNTEVYKNLKSKKRCEKVHGMELVPSHWPEGHASSLPQVAM